MDDRRFLSGTLADDGGTVRAGLNETSFFNGEEREELGGSVFSALSGIQGAADSTPKSDDDGKGQAPTRRAADIISEAHRRC